MRPHKSEISLLELFPAQCNGNVYTSSTIDGVFHYCGEMFSTGRQCQLPELVLRLDWKAKDTDKRYMYLEFRLIAFIMTAGKNQRLKLGSDCWSCKVRLEVFIISSNRTDWVISILTILDNIPPLKIRLSSKHIQTPCLPRFNNQGGQESFTAGMHPYNLSRLHQLI